MSRRGFRAQEGAWRLMARKYRRSASSSSINPVSTSSISAAALPMQQGSWAAPGSWLSCRAKAAAGAGSVWDWRAGTAAAFMPG